MPESVVGSFRIDEAAQEAFARLTGDWNPIHIDAEFARRSSFGQRVVHGINTLLHALELCCSRPEAGELLRSGLAGARLSVQFVQPAFLDEELRVVDVSRDAKRWRLSVRTGEAELVKIAIQLGAPDASGRGASSDDIMDVPGGAPRREPAVRWPDDSGSKAFSLAVAAPASALAAAYPAMLAIVGARTVASIALLSTVVGMEWPGLRSLFAEARILLRHDEAYDPHRLDMQVTTAEPRHGLTTVACKGSTIDAELMAFFRPADVVQPRLEDLRDRVEPGCFRGWTAIVAGGSRGLGELCAKIAALGGAEVIITYRGGAASAGRVRDEIVAGGGTCTALPFDAAVGRLPLPAATDPARPAFLFYSASPHIFRRRSRSYDRQWLDEFIQIYVDGFIGAVDSIRAWSSGPVSVVYPSTEALDNPVPQILEYAAAKAAGEAAAAALAAGDRRLRIATPRLPRLLTEQTNTIVNVETADPVTILLPILRQAMVQGDTRT